MPSQYRPQLLGWIDDLDKGTNYLSGADDRLLYANDNYCAFLRKTSSDQIFYLCISTIIIVCLIPAIYICFLLIFDLISKKRILCYLLLLLDKFFPFLPYI